MKQEKKQKQAQSTSKKVEESLSYTVEVRDRTGRVIQRISAPSRSYVEQWNQLMNVQAAQASKTIKDTGGINRTIEEHTVTLQGNALAGFTIYGIRVGKGTTAVAIDDFALETPLEEGVGVDEFNHQTMVGYFTEPAVVGPTCSWTAKRIMLNNSGATISGIREIGYYVRGYDGATTREFLGFRDVLPSPVSVPHGGSITVTYTIGVTV